MNELARLLDLVPIITARQGISIRELAKEFKVTEKEIVRNLSTLFLCGLPGYTPLELMEIDFEDGFVTIRNAETLAKPRSMSAVDATFSLISLSHMAEQEPEIRERVIKLMSKIGNSLELPIAISPPESAALMKDIENALQLHKRISFDYVARYRDEVTQRVVSPIEMNRVQGSVYLSGFCHRAQELRTFALTRISNLTVLDETAVTSVDEGRKVELRVRILKRYRKFIEFFGGERCTTFSSLWAVRAITSASGDVELLEPREIRQEIHRRATLALAEYTSLG